jgi:hypothetical protein
MLDQLMSSAATATDDDRAMLAAIMRSIEAADLPPTLTLSPAVCAGLFPRLHRGTWRADRIQELAQTMRAGAWRASDQGSIGFGPDGLIDGTHRLGASALSGHTLHRIPVVFYTRQAWAALLAKLGGAV